ncbi:MAG TPA: chemotaxis response regulator protein-glutamate methylesterase [Aromatoleum sp.]|uniref:protein-glutamate methylesterase/protein-glutamine glutaminase n=1 Tax=Aromatoleum sp. TaxID=2307007 RepID=UPI002B47515B|nr:chemotaxis response regulator protein-glutamate methylesterase [Aromatoleum sp.]HJV28104.1 chemotaxis response regulator protein-glutamate methylesterase [Aromatoleum sp.]
MSIKVLIVDDSALVRQVLREILSAQAGIEVVGAAADPIYARDLIKRLNPDVISLDIEMPRMDGLEFLGRLMRLRPMPVVMVSSLTERGSEVTLRALELGAVDYIAKPRMDIERGLAAHGDELGDKIRAAASARLRRTALAVPASHTADAILPAIADPITSTEKLLILGASTGGTEALREVLVRMPADAPAILVAQHMPPGFTQTFARRLDSMCGIHVKEAEHGERVLPGHCYIAPGHSHLLLARSGANYTVELNAGLPVNRHRPSVDALFRSAANCAGGNAVGAILTGMGKDGAAGLLEMRNRGAHTIAQDEASCVVFGMPREAIALNAAAEVAPLEEIAGRMLSRFARGAQRAIRL